jgi:hypothetical protein
MQTYAICANAGGTTPPAVQALAPNNASASIGDYDAGGQSNDARLSFTAPLGNTIDSYSAQRAFLGAATTSTAANCNLGGAAPSGSDSIGVPAGAAFSTIGTPHVTAGSSLTISDNNLAPGGYCYRIVALHPSSGAPSYSNYATANVGAPTPSLTVTPPFTANEDSDVSSTVPGIGQHTYTFQATGLAGTVDITVLSSANVIANAGGTFSFLDDNGDRKADFTCPSATVITAVNGIPIVPSGCVANYPIPSNGMITVTIDSATPNQRVRVVMWQDLTNNGGIDLNTAGSVPTLTSPRVLGLYDPASSADGLIAVSGRTFYFGREATAGTQFIGNTFTCDTGGTPAPMTVVNSAPVFRHDAANNTFSAGPASASSNRFRYDASDFFRINGSLYTFDQFKTSLNADSTGAGDVVAINYIPDPAGTSEFSITCNHGYDAPDGNNGGTDPTAAVGNFDGGTAPEDVRLQFVTPNYGVVTTYQIQRADAGPVSPTGTSCTAADVPTFRYATVGSVTQDPNLLTVFIDFDRPGTGVSPRTFCYRVRVQDPTTALENFSRVVGVTVGAGAADTLRPISTSSILAVSSGFINVLDTGDRLQITFSEGMNIPANAVIRLTDGDCGTVTNAGPPECPVGNSNTQADVVCGTNAVCSLDSSLTTLTLTMTSAPTVQVAGGTPGVQFSVVITDSSGITDLSGNVWDLTCDGQSNPPGPACLGGIPDRVIP